MYRMWLLGKYMTPRHFLSEVPCTHAHQISNQVGFSCEDTYFIRLVTHQFKLSIENNSAVLFIA